MVEVDGVDFSVCFSFLILCGGIGVFGTSSSLLSDSELLLLLLLLLLDEFFSFFIFEIGTGNRIVSSSSSELESELESSEESFVLNFLEPDLFSASDSFSCFTLT